MAEKIELVIKIPKYYLTHPQDYTCLAECVRRGIPLPKGHGRIGDFDLLERHVQAEWMNNEISNGDWIQFREWLRVEPTIIEADKEGAEDV